MVKLPVFNAQGMVDELELKYGLALQVRSADKMLRFELLVDQKR